MTSPAVGSGFQSFTPQDSAERLERPTKVEGSHPFQFKFHPSRWDIIGGKVMPVLGKLKYAPGVDGVDLSRRDANGKQRPIMGIARAQSRERGWLTIPVDAIPDKWANADGSKSYLKRPDGRPDVTISIFETVFSDSNIIESNTAMYVEWMEWLISEEIIPPCPPHTLRALLSKKQETALREADMAAKFPSHEPDYKRAQKDVAIVEAALEAAESKVGAKKARPSKSSAVRLDEEA